MCPLDIIITFLWYVGLPQKDALGKSGLAGMNLDERMVRPDHSSGRSYACTYSPVAKLAMQ